MGFFDWMKKEGRGQEPETEPGTPLGSTKKGNPIELVHSGDWHSETGIRETRVHLGKSAEGFHGGFQDVPVGGDGAIRWSNPQEDVEGGWRAAYGMYDRWKKDHAQDFLSLENNAIREFERKNGSRSAADGKQPEGGSEPTLSRPQSKYGDLFDTPPATEAEAKKRDALVDMTLIVQHIARDPDPNVAKYRADFENAVSGMRSAFFRPEVGHERTEKSGTRDAPRDAEKQRESASPQQGRGGWNWER
jgi:hypothetical protein